MFNLLLLICFLPHPLETHVRCDIIERNHRVLSNSIFNQWIFWEWLPGDRFHARDWCPVTNENITLRKRKGGWELTRIMANGRRYVVLANEYRETWTEEDPEVEDRKLFPIKFRSKIWHREDLVSPSR